MTAKEQTDKLANYIMANFPEDITGGGAGDVAIAIVERFRRNIPCHCCRDGCLEYGCGCGRVPGDKEEPLPE